VLGVDQIHCGTRPLELDWRGRYFWCPSCGVAITLEDATLSPVTRSIGVCAISQRRQQYGLPDPSFTPEAYRQTVGGTAFVMNSSGEIIREEKTYSAG
jgi:hypothetical protein